MKIFKEIKVECYSGYKGDEVPRKITLGGEEYMITAIRKRWYEKGVKPDTPLWENFTVKVGDGEQSLIKHELVADTWKIFL